MHVTVCVCVKHNRTIETQKFDHGPNMGTLYFSNRVRLWRNTNAQQVIGKLNALIGGMQSGDNFQVAGWMDAFRPSIRTQPFRSRPSRRWWTAVPLYARRGSPPVAANNCIRGCRGNRWMGWRSWDVSNSNDSDTWLLTWNCFDKWPATVP